jgi:hypothetical protein
MSLMAPVCYESGKEKLKTDLMKKLLIATLVLAGSAVAVNAQEVSKDSSAISTTTSTTVTTSAATVVQDGYVSIKPEQLPDAVKKALETQDFKGWIINAASVDKKEEKYVVELKNGADTKKVKINKDGKVLND